MSSAAPPYHFERVDGHSIVTLDPSLNDVQWASIEQIGTNILSHLQQEQGPRLLVDLSALNYMGSAMVALVVRVWKAVNERGGRMVVVNRNSMVLEVLRIAGLEKHWTIVSTREEAADELGARGDGASGGGSVVLAVLTLIVTALAAIAVFAPQVVGDRLTPAALRGASYALAAAGLILGTALTMRSAGGLRFFAVLLVLASIASGGVGAYRHIGPHKPELKKEDPPKETPAVAPDPPPADGTVASPPTAPGDAAPPAVAPSTPEATSPEAPPKETETPKAP